MCNYWVAFNNNIVDADVDAIATSSGDFGTGIGSIYCADTADQ